MTATTDLDRLLTTMDVAVQNFAVVEVTKGKRLIGQPVDAIMVHYVLAGTMHMAIPGQPTVVCGPGSVALVPPGMAPQLSPQEGPAENVDGAESAVVSRDGLLIFDAADGRPGDLRMIAGIILATHSGSFGLLDKLRSPIVEDLGEVPIVRHAYQVMLAEISGPGLGAGALTGALMKTCLVLVLRRFLSRPGAEVLIGGLGDPRLAPAIVDVLERPAAPHNLASLAARAGMGRSTFSRVFAGRLGMAPMEFVAKTRLHHAAGLLRASKLPIKVVAASTGFASRSHFSKAFRDAYALDPRSYRRQRELGMVEAPLSMRTDRS